MTRIRTAASLAAAALLALLPRLSAAQDAASAFYALVLTPVGALPPLVRTGMLQQGPAGGEFQLRYGQYKYDGSDMSMQNFGLGGEFQTGIGRTGVTLGLQTCQGCAGTPMLGLDYTTPIVQGTSDAGADTVSPSAMHIAFSASGGISRPLDSDQAATLMSAAVGLPTSLSARVGGSAQLVPFFTPAFGMGLIASGGTTARGVHLMLGGGVGIARIGSGFGATLSFQKILVEGSPTQWGLGLTWRDTQQ